MLRKRNGYGLIFKIVVRKRKGYGLIFKIVVRKRNVYGSIFKIVVRKRNGHGNVSKPGQWDGYGNSNRTTFVISSQFLMSSIVVPTIKYFGVTETFQVRVVESHFFDTWTIVSSKFQGELSDPMGLIDVAIFHYFQRAL